MKLTVLGSGTMVPDKIHNPAGYLLETEKVSILLDAGTGVIRHLVDYGFSIQNIDVIFVSHFHTDHFSDVFSLIHTRWVDDVYHSRPHKTLIIFGPVGLKKRWKLWRQIFWVEPHEDYPLVIKEIKREKSFTFKDAKLDFFPVTHVQWFPSIGVSIINKKKKVVYTGDIGSKHSLIKLSKTVKDTNLLIIEAAYVKPTPNHYSIGQVQDLVESSLVNKVLVVHINPTSFVKVKKIIKSDKRFIIAKDGLKITV